MHFTSEELKKIPCASIEALYGGLRGRRWNQKCDNPTYVALDNQYPTRQIFDNLGGKSIYNQFSACMLGAGNARKEAALQALCGFHTTHIHGITVEEAEFSKAAFLKELTHKKASPPARVDIVNGEFTKFLIPHCDKIIAAGGTFNNTSTTVKMIGYLQWLKEYCRRRSGKIIFDYSHPFENDFRLSEDCLISTPETELEINWLTEAAAYHFKITFVEVELVHFVENLPDNGGYRIHILGRNTRDGNLVNLIRYARYTNDFMEKIFTHCGLEIVKLIDCPVYTVAILQKR